MVLQIDMIGSTRDEHLSVGLWMQSETEIKSHMSIASFKNIFVSKQMTTPMIDLTIIVASVIRRNVPRCIEYALCCAACH